MSQHRIYFHLVWSTHRRMPMIDEDTARFLDGYLRRVAIRERVDVVGLAILRTHVHVVVRTEPRVDLPHVAQAMKGGSSYAVNHLPGNRTGLRWEGEYHVSTVSPGQVARVLRYLERQAERHPEEAVSPRERRGVSA